MEFQVNTNQVILRQQDQVESGEYNVTECNFTFSSEYDGLTKKAVFTGEDGTAYLQTIVDNKCSIPSEILEVSQVVEIGVYAYDVENEELVLRYSPEPTQFYIHQGSYKEAQNSTPPTPSEIEQLQAQITTNANDIEEIQDNINDINEQQAIQDETIQNNTNAIGIINETIGTINENIGDLQEEQVEQNRNIQANADNIEEIQQEQITQNTNIQKNTDDIVEINQNINEIDGHINAINEDIDNLEQDLTNYSLITETGSQINLNVNSTNYKITAVLKDKNGNVIYTSNAIDLPIESMIVNARYDNATKEIVLTLQNGNTLRISVADLISGLVSETQLETILANYYTKMEVDNLLSEKANQTSLDTTNQNLTNLTGRVSKNEEDIADIKEEQTTQNSDIEELQNQVETLQEDLESANAEIEELNTDITNMRKAMLQVEGQGTDITLENTSNNKFVELGFNGNTEQEQLSGKNLFDRDAKDRGWQLTKENYQNGIKLISTNNSGVCYILYEFPFNYNEIKDIYLNFQKTGNGFVNIYFKDIDNNDTKTLTNQQNPFALTNIPATTTKVVLYFYGSTANTGDVTIFDNIQLELGSTATSFEPYCGGIPSPNLDYHQQIKNVTGNNNVKIQNKNLFTGDYSQFNSTGGKGTTYAYFKLPDDGKRYILSLTAKNDFTVTNTTYIGFTRNGGNANGFFRWVVGGVSMGTIQKDTKLSFSPTIEQNARFISLYDKNEKTLKKFTDNFDIQLEQGSTATDFVEHEEQNLPFTLGDIELNKIDTAQDYFYKENNKWYLHKEIGSKKSNFNWKRGADYNPDVYYSTEIDDYEISNNIPLCNYFQGIENVSSESIMVGKTNQIAFRADRNYIRLYVNTSLTAEQLNALDLELYYKLYQPTNIEITDTTLIEQLEATLQARSYDDITYITSTSEELGFDMDVESLANANKVIDSLDTRLLALEGNTNQSKSLNVSVDTKNITKETAEDTAENAESSAESEAKK